MGWETENPSLVLSLFVYFLLLPLCQSHQLLNSATHSSGGRLVGSEEKLLETHKMRESYKPQKELEDQCHACSKFAMAIVRTGQCFPSFFFSLMYPHSTSSSLSLILSKRSLDSLLNKTQSILWVKTTVLVLMRHLSLLFTGFNSSGPIIEKLWEGLKSEFIHNAVIFLLCRFNKHKSKFQAHQKIQELQWFLSNMKLHLQSILLP